MGHWKNRWIQTPRRILMDPCIKQAPVWSKWFWIILWPLAYNRLELDSIRKIINFWYTFGWKWRVFATFWDCRTHVRMTSMTSSVERTDLDFKISVALRPLHIHNTGKIGKLCCIYFTTEADTIKSKHAISFLFYFQLDYFETLHLTRFQSITLKFY